MVTHPEILQNSKQLIASELGVFGVLEYFALLYKTKLPSQNRKYFKLVISNERYNGEIGFTYDVGISNRELYYANKRFPEIGDMVMVLDTQYDKSQNKIPESGPHWKRIKGLSPGSIGKVVHIARSTNNIGVEFPFCVGSSPQYQTCSGKAKIGHGCYLHPELVVVIGQKIQLKELNLRTPNMDEIDEFMNLNPSVDGNLIEKMFGINEQFASNIKITKENTKVLNLAESESAYNSLHEIETIQYSQTSIKISHIEILDVSIELPRKQEIKNENIASLL